MLKFFPTVLILVFACLGFNPIFASAQEVHLGCKVAWDEPKDTNNMGLWTDVAGFAYVTTDAEVWDPLDESRVDDPALRELPCEAFNITATGTYTVGVRVYDGSRNHSDPAWLTFQVIDQDIVAPENIIQFCLKGTLNGRPTKFCGQFDSPSQP